VLKNLLSFQKLEVFGSKRFFETVDPKNDYFLEREWNRQL
jgi:hypothetical protein